MRDVEASEAHPKHSFEPQGYFNYFTEVEEEFVRRRGKPLLISPMDWALVETWKNAGIPLQIVLRGINEAFDSHDAKGRHFRKVNSLLYCQQSVEAAFAEYKLSQVGSEQTSTETAAPSGSKAKRKADTGIPRDVLLDFITRSDDDLRSALTRANELGKSNLGEALERARKRLAQIKASIEQSAKINSQAIERDFDSIDRLLIEAAREAIGESELESISKDAQSQLRSFRNKMDKDIYAQTVENFVLR